MSHRLSSLCRSGFDRDNEWGYRSMEPNRCCITSIALVPLKTGISQPGVSSEPNTADQIDTSNGYAPPEINVNSTQLATAQKLLLFWRKPAVRELKQTRAIVAANHLRYSGNAGGMPSSWKRRVCRASLSRPRCTYDASGHSSSAACRAKHLA